MDSSKFVSLADASMRGEITAHHACVDNVKNSCMRNRVGGCSFGDEKPLCLFSISAGADWRAWIIAFGMASKFLTGLGSTFIAWRHANGLFTLYGAIINKL